MSMTRIPILAIIVSCLSCWPAWGEFRDWKADYQSGIDAAKTGDFKTAILRLELVLEETGPNPGVVFNLALANANAGSFVKAAMLFRLYLVMVPDAANAPAVTSEIARIDKEIAKGETELFKRAIAAASEFPDVPSAETYVKPKKVEIFDSIEWAAQEVGDRAIAEEARALARKAAAAVGYEYEPSDRGYLLRDNLDDAGDIVAVVEARNRYDKPDDYWENLQAAVVSLGHYFPGIAAHWLSVLPQATVKLDGYRGNEMIRLALSAGVMDDFYTRHQWDKDFIYLKEIALRNAVLDGRPPSEWKGLAEEILKQKPDSAEAWAALSQSKKALKHILEKGGNPFNPIGEWYNSIMVARISLLVGNFDGITRSRRQVVKLSGKEGDFSKMADLLLNTSRGKIKSAVNQIVRRDHEWDDDWQKSIDYQFAETAKAAAIFLIGKGKFDQTREMLAKGVRAREVPALLRRMADSLEQNGKASDAKALRTEADRLALEIGGGWQPRSGKHREIVERWQNAGRNYLFASYDIRSVERKVADALNTEYCASDTKSECIINSLYFAAKAWGNARLIIRALEKIDPDSAIWLDLKERQALRETRETALKSIALFSDEKSDPKGSGVPGQTQAEADEVAQLLVLANLLKDGDRADLVKTYKMAADRKSTDAVVALIGLFDPNKSDLPEWEVTNYIADGLLRGDKALYDQVIGNFENWDEELRVELQSLLSDEGYYDGELDGLMNPETRQAIDKLFAGE